MTTEAQVLVAFLLYLVLFGWIGYRRGTWRELWVMVVTVVTWVLLQERGNVVVRLANFGGKLLALVGAGGLTGGDTASALQAVSDAPDIVTPANEPGFLFLVWAVIVLLTYIFTSSPHILNSSKHNGMAILLGIANGFIFASLLLPVLANLLPATDAAVSTAPLQNLWTLVSQTVQFLISAVRGFWEWVQPLNPLIWLLLITLALVLAALTLRRGAKVKS